MAKTLTVKDPVTGIAYTLEYTRKAVEMMEREGFVVTEVDNKPMTSLPALFAGAFKAHHRFVKRDVIDRIYAGMSNKEELIGKLVDMYNDPIIALLAAPADSEENPTWTANW